MNDIVTDEGIANDKITTKKKNEGSKTLETEHAKQLHCENKLRSPSG
jgi:hypothetical protein